MPNIPYQYLTAGQKARLNGGNRRRRRAWNGRGRWRGSNGFSNFPSARNRRRRSQSVAYWR